MDLLKQLPTHTPFPVTTYQKMVITLISTLRANVVIVALKMCVLGVYELKYPNQ